jgi:hypothetical protein
VISPEITIRRVTMARIAFGLLMLICLGCQHAPAPPPVTVYHIRNWHWVPRDAFATDLKAAEPGLTEDQINERYSRFLDELEVLQNEQSNFIRELATTNGLRSAFYEGVTDENLQAFQEANDRIKVIHRLHNELTSSSDPEEATVRHKLDQLASELRDERLQLGAIGRLIREGGLDTVIPLESTETLEAANPITPDGRMSIDSTAVRAREAEMVRRIALGGPVAIVVLGGDHDLKDAFQATGRPLSYIFLEATTYKRLANSSPNLKEQP